MESNAFQDPPRKRIKKRAERFTDHEIRASLNEDAENVAFIYEDSFEATVMYWNAYNGPIAMLDEDPVRAYAQLEFLRRHGYPILRSTAEIEAYATQHNWPRKQRKNQ